MPLSSRMVDFVLCASKFIGETAILAFVVLTVTLLLVAYICRSGHCCHCNTQRITEVAAEQPKKKVIITRRRAAAREDLKEE